MPANTLVDKTLKDLEDGKIPKLEASIGKHSNFETGDYVARAETQSAPEVVFTAASSDKTYLLLNLDLDAPFINLPFMSPILHLSQPSLKLSSATPGKLEAMASPIAPWAPAGPPPFAAPHRYVFFLFEQPAAFDPKKYMPADGKPMGIGPRVRFSLDDFVKEAGLGDVIACNYFKSN